MAKTQTTDPTTIAGMIAHTEFASTDPAATKKFLEKVFGWRFQTMALPQGDYHAFETPGGARGAVRGTKPQEPPGATNYVQVANLDDARKKVEKAGGTIVLPRVDVPGMGSFFWFQVPGGPVLAAWWAAPARRN